MSTPSVATDLADAVTREEADGSTDPYDTHPSLRDRLAALTTQTPGQLGDVRPATSLLRRLPRWERQLLGTIVDDNWARALKPIDWDKVPETVYVPAWQESVTEMSALVAGRSTIAEWKGRCAAAGLADVSLVRSPEMASA